MRTLFPALLAALLATSAAAVEPPPAVAAAIEAKAAAKWDKRTHNGILKLEWDDLIPPDYNPDAVLDKIAAKYGIEALDDTDPRAKKALAEARAYWNNAPVVESLNGRRVRMPGLVVPLEGDGGKMSEFLLVPYYGACIHVPPPPSNQIVYVRTGPEKAVIHQMFEAVWVTGRLLTQANHQEVGDASYTLEADRVEPYK